MAIYNLSSPTSRARMIGVACMSALLVACGGGDGGTAEEAEQGAFASMREAVSGAKQATGALQELGAAAQQMAKDHEEGVTIDPVDFRELRDLLPESVGSLARKEITGEKNSAMGFTISTATAEYQGETVDGHTPYLKMTITDVGGTQGMALLALAPWSMITIDKESSSGHEKTGTYEGFPSHEQFDNSGSYPKGEMQVFIARRFVVAAEGREMQWEQIHDAVGQVDLKKLDGMKEVGVTRAK